MADLSVLSCDGPLEGAIRPPPSKSYTHRAVLLASLAGGASRVLDPLLSRDTLATVAACRAFGADISERDGRLQVEGSEIGLPEDVVNVENSGTTLRFLTSVLSAASPDGFSVLTGDASIRKRPMQPLLDALKGLGGEAWSARDNGCAPIIVRGGGLEGGVATLRGDVSSQFISSLLISAPLSARGVTLKPTDTVSKPYIDATVTTMSLFGVRVERDGYRSLSVASGHRYTNRDFKVPSDMSSAAFVAAAVALAGGKVTLRGIDPGLPQGDANIFAILREMGVAVKESGEEAIVESGGGNLDGGSFDLSDTPDLLPVVAVLALRANSEVAISGVRHARFKETDRVAMLALELRRLGAAVTEMEGGLKFEPSQLRPARLDAHDDHRLFMAFSLASLLFPSGAMVEGVESVDVSYPSFIEDLRALGARARRVPA